MAAAKDQPKVLTGNRLHDGETVYYTAHGEGIAAWSPYVAEATIAATVAEADALAKIGAAAYAANLVVDVNVVDVDSAPTHKPAQLRELIRATGPTVRLDLNKPMTPTR